MTFKSSADAVAALAARFQAALRCVGDIHVHGRGVGSTRLGTLVLLPQFDGRSNIIPLRIIHGRGDLQFALFNDFVIDAFEFDTEIRYSARTTRYLYSLLDRERREIIAFHWHPTGRSRVTSPHVHVSGARPIPLAVRPTGEVPPPLDISNAHIPTGEIEIEEVLLMLIRDLGVQPPRADWERVLSESLRGVREAQPG